MSKIPPPEDRFVIGHGDGAVILIKTEKRGMYIGNASGESGVFRAAEVAECLRKFLSERL